MRLFVLALMQVYFIVPPVDAPDMPTKGCIDFWRVWSLEWSPSRRCSRLGLPCMGVMGDGIIREWLHW